MIRFTASKQRFQQMQEICGSTNSLTVDLWWALRHVSIRDWGCAIQMAAYERKTNVRGLLGWPKRDVVFDVIRNACAL